MKILRSVVLGALFGSSFVFFMVLPKSPTIRNARDVFNNWICWQKCYSNRSCEEMSDHLNEFFLKRFNKHYLKHKNELVQLNPFLRDVTDGYVGENGALVGTLANYGFIGDFRQNFSTIYQLIQNNMPRFVSYLIDHNFVCDTVNSSEAQANDVNFIINKYHVFSKLFFSNPSKDFEREMLFTFANRCFEYCFSDLTWDDFKQHLDNAADHQLVRFLYSTIWLNLVGKGWKDWNNQTLDVVIQHASQGYRVVYVAGGADIYQLLKYGVYNIDIIDPFLKTQDQFYASNDWEWLVKSDSGNNGLGDKIVFNFDDRKIEMIRKKYKKNGTFTALLSNKKKQKIEKSITEWSVFDQDKKLLGVVTFHRRFCQQSDFVTDKKRLILMALNELYYAFLPSKYNGWNIKTEGLPQDFKIYVKQLRTPVDVNILKNIRQAEDSKFKFIRLGSHAT